MRTDNVVTLLPFPQTWPAGEHVAPSQTRDLALAMVAHELRGPLSAIRNAVAVIRLKGSDAETLDWACDLVERQARSIAARVDELLDAARVAQGKTQLRTSKVDLNTVVQHAVETVRPLVESRNHELEVVLPSASVLLEADADRLEQVIVNLLANAAKYTDRGGRIHVHVERQHDRAVLSVRDSGKGISAEYLPRIFDLFSQVGGGAQGGLGIGLYLARELVRLHGGTITAGSPGPGKGSEFVVHLPRLVEVRP
jgi:signal transduction histidine kinase